MKLYPSCRYHSELGTTLVHNEEEDSVLTPASDGWSDTPATSVSVVEPAPTEPETVEVETVEPQGHEIEQPGGGCDGGGDASTPSESGSLDFKGEFGDGDGND